MLTPSSAAAALSHPPTRGTQPRLSPPVRPASRAPRHARRAKARLRANDRDHPKAPPSRGAWRDGSSRSGVKSSRCSWAEATEPASASQGRSPVFCPRSQVRTWPRRFLRWEAQLLAEGRDCLEPVWRRVNPTTPPRALELGAARRPLALFTNQRGNGPMQSGGALAPSALGGDPPPSRWARGCPCTRESRSDAPSGVLGGSPKTALGSSAPPGNGITNGRADKVARASARLGAGRFWTKVQAALERSARPVHPDRFHSPAGKSRCPRGAQKWARP